MGAGCPSMWVVGLYGCEALSPKRLGFSDVEANVITNIMGPDLLHA